MLQAFQINCNWYKLYAPGQDPQFDINFARAVHFDFGQMRLWFHSTRQSCFELFSSSLTPLSYIYALKLYSTSFFPKLLQSML